MLLTTIAGDYYNYTLNPPQPAFPDANNPTYCIFPLDGWNILYYLYKKTAFFRSDFVQLRPYFFMFALPQTDDTGLGRITLEPCNPFIFSM